MSEQVGAKGRVVSVNLSEKKTVRKQRYECGTLVLDRGFQDDAHAGDWHRQVSLLALESIDSMRAKGLDVGPGDFAENITTEGVDVMTLPVGSVVRIGDGVVLEVSQVGKVCHNKCAIFYQAGDCVMPREGVFVVVREAGDVAVGDEIEIVSIGDGTCDRSPQESLAESESVRAGNECRKVGKEAASNG
ncbi:MAG TPA: MOSC domain-containing protein [Coriobacteriia bacterium]